MCKQHDPLRTVTLLARLYHTGMFIQHREVGITKSPMVRGARSYFREATCRPCLRLGFEFEESMKTFLENFLAACLLLVILVKLARTQPPYGRSRLD